MEGKILGQALSLSITILIFLQFPTDAKPCPFSPSPSPNSTHIEYIKTSCNTTMYPRLCYRALSVYSSKIKTNPRLLAHTALKISLKATKSTSKLVKKLSKVHGLRRKEVAALRDCMEELSDSLYEIKRSIGELVNLKGSNFDIVISDIQTWVSAALTDDDTCMDGMDEVGINQRVKVIARRHLLRISHLTSIALALVNRYASSHALPVH